MKKIGLLVLFHMLMISSFSFAEGYTCSSLATCEELGYVYTASDCGLKPTLKCPFDNSKVYCKIELPTICEIGSIYDLGFKGCRLKQIGDYTVVSTDSANKKCVGLTTGVVNTETGTGTDVLANATALCEANGSVVASHLYLLQAKKNGYNFSSDVDIETMSVLTSDVGIVNLKTGVIEKFDIASVEDEYAYVCAVEGECETNSTTVIDPTQLTCVPGAYRTNAATAPYAGGCLGNSAEAGTEDLIVETNAAGTSANYFKPSEFAVTPSDSLAASRTYALNTICSSSGLPTVDQVHNFFTVLYKKGTLASFKSSSVFTSSNGYVITNTGCYNFNATTPLASNKTCSATGGIFMVFCSYYGFSVIE